MTGKNLKQAESLVCTKNRTRELNTLDITPLPTSTVLVVKLLASCKWSAQSSPCEFCFLTAVIDTKRFVLRSTRA